MQTHLPDVTLIDGTPRVPSLAIAEHFKKRHAEVLRSIRVISQECPAEFNERNFASVEYVDIKGESRPMYQLSRDGFTLLAMGFAGKKALAWKIRYIEAFNAMESALRKQRAPQALPKPKQKALPADFPKRFPHPKRLNLEKVHNLMDRLTLSARETYRTGEEIIDTMRAPFWPKEYFPEDQRAFASAMNHAIQDISMVMLKNVQALERMVAAYKEGDRILHG